MILTIFGYPKTGKTLLFNTLTGQHEAVSKFSLSGSEFHKAVVGVPDEKQDKLVAVHGQPPIRAQIEFLDSGAVAFGEAKDTTFIDLIRRADGLVHVVRGFADPEILHTLGSVDPERDMKRIEEELHTTDFITVQKRMEKLSLEVKKIKSRELEEELELLNRLAAHLEGGASLRLFPLKAKEATLVRGYRFLSQKPLLHLVNTDEASYRRHAALASPPSERRAVVVFAGKIECELLELEPASRCEFEREYGLENYRYIGEEFVRTAYGVMNLISFFTLGREDTKAWTIEAGTTAFDAAGEVHSDIQRGFIRAEVVSWSDYLACGGTAVARDRGLLRLEGKEYVIRDGDIVNFRFNA